jgi:hypothetical protein
MKTQFKIVNKNNKQSKLARLYNKIMINKFKLHNKKQIKILI